MRHKPTYPLEAAELISDALRMCARDFYNAEYHAIAAEAIRNTSSYTYGEEHTQKLLRAIAEFHDTNAKANAK